MSSILREGIKKTFFLGYLSQMWHCVIGAVLTHDVMYLEFYF